VGSVSTNRTAGLRNLAEWVAIVVGAIVVALLVKTFLVQAFRIPSASMEDTLLIGDRVMVNKLSYRLHDVNPGDVIVFDRPEGLPGGAQEPEDLIKRVIGLPGDTLQTVDGKVLRNGEPLDEPYLKPGSTTTGIEQPVTIPADTVWVMGDNRNNSSDSRVFGPVSQTSIVGRAFVIMWPPSQFSGL
jgi:signal peptidase I